MVAESDDEDKVVHVTVAESLELTVAIATSSFVSGIVVVRTDDEADEEGDDRTESDGEDKDNEGVHESETSFSWVD